MGRLINLYIIQLLVLSHHEIIHFYRRKGILRVASPGFPVDCLYHSGRLCFLQSPCAVSLHDRGDWLVTWAGHGGIYRSGIDFGPYRSAHGLDATAFWRQSNDVLRRHHHRSIRFPYRSGWPYISALRGNCRHRWSGCVVCFDSARSDGYHNLV